MAKKKKRKVGVMYSTNTNYNFEYEKEEETLAPNEQWLKIWIDKKNRGGKIATLVKGFIGKEDDLKDLGKLLKSKCGVGGTTKDGEVIIQGNHRDKIMEILNSKGYNCKRVGS